MKHRERDPLGLARRMAAFIGEVVCAATASPRQKRKQSAVRCRRRPGHRKCSGHIIVCEKDNGDIEWQCSSCNDRGVICGWQGSPAEKAGLKAGDVSNAGDLVQLINSYQIGQNVEVSFWRGQTKSSASLTLGESPPPES